VALQAITELSQDLRVGDPAVRQSVRNLLQRLEAEEAGMVQVYREYLLKEVPLLRESDGHHIDKAFPIRPAVEAFHVDRLAIVIDRHRRWPEQVLEPHRLTFIGNIVESFRPSFTLPVPWRSNQVTVIPSTVMPYMEKLRRGGYPETDSAVRKTLLA